MPSHFDPDTRPAMPNAEKTEADPFTGTITFESLKSFHWWCNRCQKAVPVDASGRWDPTDQRVHIAVTCQPQGHHVHTLTRGRT
jgi:hypothetical protein